MMCDNCGKREANVRYSENINGVKRELNLCEECSKKLGIGNIGDMKKFGMPMPMSMSMPIDFSSFFSEFMEDFTNPEFMPLFNDVKSLKCDNCGYTFDDIVNTGRLGCANCYDVFEDRLDPIIKKIQGSNLHVGRIGKISENNIINAKKTIQDNSNREENKVSKLKEDLKQAIKEERYEDAAKLRDEIAKKEENKKDSNNNK